MRTTWRQVTVDAIDYEIVRLSEGGAVTELGAFGDVFSSAGPSWRLVAGYLMLATAADDEVRASQAVGARRVQSWAGGGATGTNRLGGLVVAHAANCPTGGLGSRSRHPEGRGHCPGPGCGDLVARRELRPC